MLTIVLNKYYWAEDKILNLLFIKIRLSIKLQFNLIQIFILFSNLIFFFSYLSSPLSKLDSEIIQHNKEKLGIKIQEKIIFKKKKGKKQPNPLSCKKKKNKPIPKVEPEGKIKRKRKRIKISKHLKEALKNNDWIKKFITIS